MRSRGKSLRLSKNMFQFQIIKIVKYQYSSILLEYSSILMELGNPISILYSLLLIISDSFISFFILLISTPTGPGYLRPWFSTASILPWYLIIFWWWVLHCSGFLVVMRKDICRKTLCDFLTKTLLKILLWSLRNRR